MCCCVSIYLEKSKQYYDHSFHWNMKSARKSIRLRKGPDAVFVELTAPLEDPEEAFFQPLGKNKGRCDDFNQKLYYRNIQV